MAGSYKMPQQACIQQSQHPSSPKQRNTTPTLYLQAQVDAAIHRARVAAGGCVVNAAHKQLRLQGRIRLELPGSALRSGKWFRRSLGGVGAQRTARTHRAGETSKCHGTNRGNRAPAALPGVPAPQRQCRCWCGQPGCRPLGCRGHSCKSSSPGKQREGQFEPACAGLAWPQPGVEAGPEVPCCVVVILHCGSTAQRGLTCLLNPQTSLAWFEGTAVQRSTKQHSTAQRSTAQQAHLSA